MATATLIYFIRPNRLELFVVVRHRRRSWPGQTPPGGIWFWRKTIYFYFRFNLINGLYLQRPLRRKWPQAHLLKKQVRLSPDILWVDEMMMGSTISRYMLRIWDDNLSLAICGVDGKTTLTRYYRDRQEDNGDVPHPIWLRGIWDEIPPSIWLRGRRDEKSLSRSDMGR